MRTTYAAACLALGAHSDCEPAPDETLKVFRRRGAATSAKLWQCNADQRDGRHRAANPPGPVCEVQLLMHAGAPGARCVG